MTHSSLMPRPRASRTRTALAALLVAGGFAAGCNDGSPPPGSKPPPGGGNEPKVQTKTLIDQLAIASWFGPLDDGDQRPVVVFTPGWGGSGNVNASISALNRRFVDEGYVTLAIGFKALGAWYSDLPNSVESGLNALCADTKIPARCDAITIIGNSYGGSQNYWVINHLRNNGYDGMTGPEVLAFLSEDAGYAPPGNLNAETGDFDRTAIADAFSYGVAMIENQGDTTFPIDDCTWGNCGIRTLARAHNLQGHAILSHCPEGGNHGTRGYADWDTWIVDAVKTMMHRQKEIDIFDGYTPPTLALGNDCL